MAVDAAIAAAWRAVESLGATGAAVYAVAAGGALACLSVLGSGTTVTAQTTGDRRRRAAPSLCRWELEGGAEQVGRLDALFPAGVPSPPFSQGLQEALDHLASALEQRRVTRALARSRAHAELLYRVTALSHPRSAAGDALVAIAQALVEDAGFAAAAVYRFGEGQLIREAWYSASEGDNLDGTAPLEKVALRCVLTRTTQAEQVPPREPNDAVEPDAAIRSIAAPLLRDDLAFGALAVTQVASDCDDAEMRFVEMLAEPVAVALENVGVRAGLYTRLHEKAAYAQEELETVVREAPAGLVVLDDEWRVLRLNPAACAILDCTENDALGQPLLAVVKDAHVVENLAKLIRQESHLGRRPTIEARLDGERCDVLLGIVRLGPGYLVSLSDITALKDVDRLKSEIIANVSHEFRAPLASIKAYNELLQQPGIGSDAETRRRFLAIISEEVDYLTDLITNMLDLSRLQSGHLDLTYTWLDLGRLVGDVVNMLAAQAEARHITFDVQGGDAELLLWADRQLMITVLKNLIVNAVKYNRVGGHVTIEIAGGDDEVTLRVRDDGVGIPSSAIPQLFDKFYRVVSTTESGIQGTGLGLALTKAAVDAHGGSVSVSSSEGKGAEFTVTLPNRASSEPEHAGS